MRYITKDHLPPQITLRKFTRINILKGELKKYEHNPIACDTIRKSIDGIKNQIVVGNVKLIYKIIKPYVYYRNYDDIKSEAFVALIKAVDKFDVTYVSPTTNTTIQFSTYAFYSIKNSTIRTMQKDNFLSSVAWNKNRDKHQVKNVDEMSNSELPSVSYNYTNRLEISNLIKFCDDREQLVLYHKYGLNGDRPKTFLEISRIVGLTKQGVSVIHQRAIAKIRNKIKLAC